MAIRKAVQLGHGKCPTNKNVRWPIFHRRRAGSKDLEVRRLRNCDYEELRKLLRKSQHP